MSNHMGVQEQQPRGDYIVRVQCRNCSFGGDYSYEGKRIIKIPRGTVVGDSECPGCGCKTLVKR